jgi:hypothetical protein
MNSNRSLITPHNKKEIFAYLDGCDATDERENVVQHVVGGHEEREGMS